MDSHKGGLSSSTKGHHSLDLTERVLERYEDLVVLLVDDDSMTRETLREILSNLGIERIHEASNGREAIKVLGRVEVDVILTDIHMPEMDGLTLLKEVKSRWSTVPVVMVTGFPTIEIAIQAMKDGASDFIMKPFRIEQIELLMERILKDRRLMLENTRLNVELRQKREIERLNRDLMRKVHELTILYQISESFQSYHSEGEDLFEKIVQMAAKITEANKASVMLVDDSSQRLVVRASIGMPKDALRGFSLPLGEGIAGRVAKEGSPLVMDANTGVRGGEVPEFRGPASSLISVPILIKGEVVGVINVADKRSKEPFVKEDVALLGALAQKAALAVENHALYESIYSTLMDTLLSLVTTIEAKDPYTKDHSQRVTTWAVQIAQLMGLEQDEVDGIKFAGYLHDIGKIGIPDSILLKPTRLTLEEEEIIRSHPIIGERIVKPLGLMPIERSVIRHHHERWDGKGYPDGLRGEEIPLPARILAVADSYDAIISDRVYKRARTEEDALKELQQGVGTQFDGRVVEAFAQMLKEGKGPPTSIDGMEPRGKNRSLKKAKG